MLTENEKRVLRYILVRSREFPSINKVAKVCNITPNGTYKILKKLEGKGILKFKKISNIKSYSVDFTNEKSTNILELAFTSKTLTGRIKYRYNELKNLRKITAICIFLGSHIGNKKEPADLDVLFIFNKNKYELYDKEIRKIKEISPIKIHDIIQTKKDLSVNLKNEDKIIITALEKGVIFWGQKELIKTLKNVN